MSNTPSKGLTSLQALSLFSGLDQTHRQLLAEAFTLESHPAGHIFAHAGLTGRRDKDTLYVLLSGELAITTTPKDEKQVPVERTLKAGDWFGLITFLRGGARTATMKSLSEVQVASLTRGDYEGKVRPDATANSAFLLIVAAQLARDVRACNNRLSRAIQSSSPAASKSK